jgi:putative glutamine amidotransferase
MSRPRIAIPIPTSMDDDYNQRSWPQYAAAVERSGGDAVKVPLGQSAAATAQLIAECQGVLLPGSGADVDPHKYGEEPIAECAPADPAREDVDELLLRDAQRVGKPVLTICFGTQMLNVSRGGSLVQHLAELPVKHRARGVVEAHEAAVAPDSLLGRTIVSPEAPESDGLLHLAVNSSHHQAIATPGEGLRVAARSPEDGVVEAIESATDGPGGGFLVGVQWHPERTFDESPASRALFARFVAEAAAWELRRESNAVVGQG